MSADRPQLSDIRVRHACPSDAKLMAELDALCGGSGTKMDYRLSLGCKGFVAFIAEYQEVPVGFATAEEWRTSKKKVAVKSALDVWSFGVLAGGARRLVTSQLMSTLKRQMRESKCEEITFSVGERDVDRQLLLRDYGFRWVETAKRSDEDGDAGYLFVFRPWKPVNRITKHLADAAGETS